MKEKEKRIVYYEGKKCVACGYTKRYNANHACVKCSQRFAQNRKAREHALGIRKPIKLSQNQSQDQTRAWEEAFKGAWFGEDNDLIGQEACLQKRKAFGPTY